MDALNFEPMAFFPLRDAKPAARAMKVQEAWLERLERELARPDLDRNEFCLSVLRDIYYPEYSGREIDELPEVLQLSMMNLDPRNITMEPEYYVEVENKGVFATDPPGAPAAFHARAVAAPEGIVSDPLPTSGQDYLAGREIRVLVVLPVRVMQLTCSSRP